MANYFKYLPNVYIRKADPNVDQFVLTKNFFRRIKIKEETRNFALGFTQYSIQEGERPDTLAQKFYGDSTLDWVILICNNIINVYSEWPLTREELVPFVESKYGNLDGIHHYETLEIKDTKGQVLLPAGITVKENFVYTRSDGTIVPTSQSIIAISNYEYEANINEEKRNIYLLKSGYINEFVDEFKALTEYLPNDELNEFDIKQTKTKIINQNNKYNYDKLIPYTAPNVVKNESFGGLS
jgi:hypothetical protein